MFLPLGDRKFRSFLKSYVRPFSINQRIRPQEITFSAIATGHSLRRILEAATT